MASQSFLTHLENVFCVRASECRGFLFGGFVKSHIVRVAHGYASEFDPSTMDIDIFFLNEEALKDFASSIGMKVISDPENEPTKCPKLYKAIRIAYEYTFEEHTIKVDLVWGDTFPAYDTYVSYVTARYVKTPLTSTGHRVEFSYGIRYCHPIMVNDLITSILGKKAVMTPEYLESVRHGAEIEKPCERRDVFVKQVSRIFTKYVLRGWDIHTPNGVPIS